MHGTVFFTIQDCIDTWHHKECQKRTIDQSADRYDGHWTNHIRTTVAAYDHWKQTEDRRQCRHEDWTKSGFSGFDDCLVFGHTLFTQLIDLVYQHDTVIYDDTGKHDKSDQGDDTDFASGYPKPHKSAGKGKWNGKQDNKW